MPSEVDTITKEFEKLLEEQGDLLSKEIKDNSHPVDQLKVRCTAGEVCHGGDLKP
jgi:hypothetical protein